MCGPADPPVGGVVAGVVHPCDMAVFHLQCVVHRGCVSGIALGIEQITARTDAEAISEAKARFTRLLGPRSGLTILKDDAGRLVWTPRLPLSRDAPAEARQIGGQTSWASDIRAGSGEG